MLGALAHWQPAAVVFDCDGLLVDTEPCWTQAESELFARRGLAFGRAEKAELLGRALDPACAVIAARFGEPDAVEAIRDELLQLVVRAIGAHASVMPGARQVVEEVAARVPVAVASNSSHALVDLALRRADLTALLPVVVSADDVAEGKPAPDVYLLACQRLDAEPEQCLAFEDSPTGLAAAQTAGLRTVGAPTLPELPLPADVVVASLTDTGLLGWIRGWR